MQTFLTHSSFILSAKYLDNKRLGKQIVEALQIYNTLTDGSKAWSNHPAVKMWSGYEPYLMLYGMVHYYEWRWRFKQGQRGGRERHKSGEGIKLKLEEKTAVEVNKRPLWTYDERLIESHRSNLIRKFPEHYRKFWPDVPDNLPYFWPTKESE